MLLPTTLTFLSLAVAVLASVPAQKPLGQAEDLYSVLLTQEQHEYCSAFLSYRPETHTRTETEYSTVTKSQLTTGTVYAPAGAAVVTVTLEKEITFTRTSTVVAAAPIGWFSFIHALLPSVGPT